MYRIIAFIVLTALMLTSCNPQTDINTVDQPDLQVKNSHYVGNKAPLVNTPFIKLPVGSIQPAGWVKKQLELQADGYFGHLGEISSFLIKDNNSWLSTDGTGDHGWEELPYWLKGYSNLAWILQRPDMIEESKLWIEAVLNSQQADGWFGPDKGRTGAATNLEGRVDLWPNMIMLFILQDYYSYSPDERVITLMSNYFTYLNGIADDQFLIGYWPSNRGGDLLYSVYWLYNHTGNKMLLELANKVHRKSVNWVDGIPDWHNVNMSQSFGEPATFWMQSQDSAHLLAANRNYEEIRKLYGQVPGAMFGSDENCREGHTDPRQAIETCGMVEMMLSTEILFTISGDVAWADRCEDVAFNSYPAALTADMKALRYLTSPNMVQSDAGNKSPGIQNGGPMFLMDPNRHRCCQHNQGHGWPYYAEHLWAASCDNGLAAVLYAASEVKAIVGDGIPVRFVQETNYPFDDQIKLTSYPDDPVKFPLYLRIPGWCTNPTLTINGEAWEGSIEGQFFKVTKTWMTGDEILLTLPMQVNTRIWSDNKNSVSVDYGPLTFSLQIEEEYRQYGDYENWPAWEIYPASNWNYGLLPASDDAQAFEVIFQEYPADDMPFTHQGNPITIKARGALIPGWGVDENNLIQPLPDSPVTTDQPITELTLIPMGAARLRIASFPQVEPKL